MRIWKRSSKVRARTKPLVSLGDCAVTANVPSMRNPFRPRNRCYNRAYVENVTLKPGVPDQIVPTLAAKARPIHEFVTRGCLCPGLSALGRHDFLCRSTELLEGARPELSSRTRFGA